MVGKRDAFERDAADIEGDTVWRTSPGSEGSTQPVHGPRYHAVMTDARGGQSLHPLPAYGDDEAIALALAAAGGDLVEVWDGPRLVGRFNIRTP